VRNAISVLVVALSVIGILNAEDSGSSTRFHRQFLQVSPGRVDYGTVQVGSSLSKTVAVKNVTGHAMTVSASASSAAFHINGVTLPLSLAPGGSANVNVTYSPATAVTTAASLTFSATGSLRTSARVSLVGTGISGATASLSVTPGSVNFGSVQVGATATVPATLTNSGNSPSTISRASVTGTGFSLNGLALPMTLQAGQAVTFSLLFVPPTATSDSGNVALANDSPQPTLSINLTGTGVSAGGLAVSPTSVNFGSVQVGSQAASNVTISNSGGQTVNVLQGSTTGTGFKTTGLTLPMALAAGQKFTFSVDFGPTASGSASGSLSLTSDGSNPTLAIPLSGTGTVSGQLGATASLDFGSVTVGSSKNLSASLSATGADVVISAVNVTGSEFATSGFSLPATIKAGQSQPFTVSFAPQASGSATATVSFTSNASNSPTESLTGVGATAIAHSVDLSWTASASSVAGYNVYRGGVSGGPYTRVNSGVDSAVIFTDSSVQAGQTYFYTVTAVDSVGTESARSNEVQATVPTP